MSESLDYTPASQWKSTRRNGVACTLPSGQKARLKRTLTIMHALENGSLPNPLGHWIGKLLAGGGDTQQEMAAKMAEQNDGEVSLDLSAVDEEAMTALVALIAQEIPEIFVMPRVYAVPEGADPGSWEPDDPDGISIIEVNWEDRLFAFNFAQGGPAQLERFPDPTQAMVAREDGGRIPSVALPDSSD